MNIVISLLLRLVWIYVYAFKFGTLLTMYRNCIALVIVYVHVSAWAAHSAHMHCVACSYLYCSYCCTVLSHRVAFFCGG